MKLRSDHYDRFNIIVLLSSVFLAWQFAHSADYTIDEVQGIRMVQYLMQQEQFEEALMMSWEMQERAALIHGSSSVRVAEFLQLEATVYNLMEENDKAEPVQRRAVAMVKEVLGETHIFYAGALQDYSQLLSKLGRLKEAEDSFTTALGIVRGSSELEYSQHYRNLANCVSGLGVLYLQMGRYDKAEPLFREAIDLFENKVNYSGMEEAFGQGFMSDRALNVASVKSLLGSAQIGARSYSEAGKSFREAVDLCRSAKEEIPFGNPAPYVYEKNLATYLSGLGVIYLYLGQNHLAEEAFRESLNLKQGLALFHDYRIAASYNDLGQFYSSQGRNEEAKFHLKMAIDYVESADKIDNHSLGIYWTNLGGVYQEAGEVELAGECFKKSLRSIRQAVADDHPHLGQILSNSMTFELLHGTSHRATKLCEEAVSIEIANLRRMMQYFSETELLGYARLNTLMTGPAMLELADLAAETQLNTKGVIMECMGLRRGVKGMLLESDRGRELLEARSSYETAYQKEAVSVAGTDLALNLKAELEVIDKEINLLLSEVGAEAALLPQEQSLPKLREAIPPATRLVEYFRYMHLLPDGDSEERYSAVVIGPEEMKGSVLVSLGSAEKIDQVIGEVVGKLGGNRGLAVISNEQKPADNFEGSLQQLHELLWAPLEDSGSLEGVKTVVISGDSQLHFLPFGILLSSREGEPRFLCQDYALRYVNSGRDLLVAPVKDPDEGAPKAVLLGFPDYHMELAAVENPPGAAGLSSSEIDLILQADAERADRDWLTALPGTKAEISLLGEMLTKRGYQTEILEAQGATEPKVRALVRGPEVVHLATHGFFLRRPQMDSSFQASPGFMGFSDFDSPAMYDDPMLRSGLALAGAQRGFDAWAGENPLDPASDGILLASEASALNLVGTKLVVMSACSTGKGEAMDGEGVIGLRRALAVAGADTVLMSLWPIDDFATVDFMELFYARYLSGMHPAAAWDETCRELLTKSVKEEGVFQAVRHYGPFIATSIGPVVPGDPSKVQVASLSSFPGGAGSQFTGIAILGSFVAGVFFLGLIQRFARRA